MYNEIWERVLIDKGLLTKHRATADEIAEAQAYALEKFKGEDFASRMDWPRYTLLKLLWAGWGRRLRFAKGRALPDNRSSEAVGPFVRAAILLLRACGRDDTVDQVKEAIIVVRERNPPFPLTIS